MKSHLRALSCAALILLATPNAWAARSSADCSSLSVQLKGIPEAAQAKCEAGNFGGGDEGQGRSEMIQVDRPTYWWVISHVEAGLRTYVIRREVKDIIGEYDEVFQKTEDWGDSTESADFRVRRFKATMSDGKSHADCIGFSHYAGHVPQSTGYRHHISGFFCDFSGSQPSDSRIEQLLGAIEYNF